MDYYPLPVDKQHSYNVKKKYTKWSKIKIDFKEKIKAKKSTHTISKHLQDKPKHKGKLLLLLFYYILPSRTKQKSVFKGKNPIFFFFLLLFSISVFIPFFCDSFIFCIQINVNNKQTIS